MSEDDKGKKFLDLIDKQNNLQWKIIEKLILLIDMNWTSSEIKNELEILAKNYSSITKELNSLDENNSVL